MIHCANAWEGACSETLEARKPVAKSPDDYKSESAENGFGYAVSCPQHYFQEREMKKHKLMTALIIISLVVTPLASQGIAESNAEPYLTITDSTGHSTVLQTKPQRVVYLNPNVTETVFALGAGETLAGRTDYCNYPQQVAAVPSIGDMYNVNIETTVSLEPDVVICSAFISQETIDAIRNLGIPLIVLNMQTTLEGTFDFIRQTGRILAKEDNAEKLVTLMKERIEAVKQKTSSAEPVTTYYCVGYGEYGDFTATGDTYINELIKIAGGRNSAQDGQYWTYSREQLLEKDPFMIVFPEYSYSNFDLDKQFFQTNEPYNQLTAVKEGRMYKINGDIIDRQGPRTAEAVEALAAILHPELF